MKKIVLLLAVFLSALWLAEGPAKAGLWTTIDISDDGLIEAFFGSAVDFSLLNTGAVGPAPQVAATPADLTVTSTLTTSQSSTISDLMTQVTTLNNFSGMTITDVVRVRTVFTDLLLPGGTPLLLESSIVTTGASNQARLNFATNLSFVDEVPIVGVAGAGIFPAPPTFSFSDPAMGGLLASIPGGNVSNFNDDEFALRPRPGATFDLLSNVLIGFTLPNGTSLQVQGTTAVHAVPETASIVAWGACIALGLVVAYRRRRAGWSV